MPTHKSRATADRMSLRALLRADEELMRTLVREAVQQVLEAEMSEQLQTAPGERTEGRLGYRAGYY